MPNSRCGWDRSGLFDWLDWYRWEMLGGDQLLPNAKGSSRWRWWDAEWVELNSHNWSFVLRSVIIVDNYQTEMLRKFRNVNIDYLLVGFYQSTQFGSCFNDTFVESLFDYQSSVEDSIVLVYGTKTTWCDQDTSLFLMRWFFRSYQNCTRKSDDKGLSIVTKCSKAVLQRFFTRKVSIIDCW